jgi:REP element-mobilizing transposase RayT
MHNRKLNRLKNYDYSECGSYFVTICAHNRIEYFGKIKNNTMILNSCGEIVQKFWQEIPRYYNNVNLDVFAILPNHIHGIIMITNNKSAILTVQNNTVGTEHCSVPIKTTKNYGLLSKIVKSFKNVCIKTIRGKFKDHVFQWQRSFYDHVIRNEKSLENIQKYIIYNHLKWVEDIENRRDHDNIKGYYG